MQATIYLGKSESSTETSAFIFAFHLLAQSPLFSLISQACASRLLKEMALSFSDYEGLTIQVAGEDSLSFLVLGSVGLDVGKNPVSGSSSFNTHSTRQLMYNLTWCHTSSLF